VYLAQLCGRLRRRGRGVNDAEVAERSAWHRSPPVCGDCSLAASSQVRGRPRPGAPAGCCRLRATVASTASSRQLYSCARRGAVDHDTDLICQACTCVGVVACQRPAERTLASYDRGSILTDAIFRVVLAVAPGRAKFRRKLADGFTRPAGKSRGSH